MKKLLSLLMLCSIGFTGISQCTWNVVSLESYEYNTAIPYLVPGKVFHTTPQTTALANCVRTGTRGMYLNIIDGQTGLLYSQPFTDVCVGQTYRFRFSFDNASATTPNPNLTFNVRDNNNVVVSTLTATGTNAWQDLTMPVFTATTNVLTFEIVTNLIGQAGNDAGFDDLTFDQCAPQPILYTISECAANQTINLYDEQTGTFLTPTGAWTGPSALTNGYLGTFVSPTNTNGTYDYTIGGAPGCADSIARFNVQIVTTPSITVPATLTGCETANLPVITGTNLTSNAHYYTGTGGTGTMLNAGAAVTPSTTSLFIFDGLTGCSDEETIAINISIQPHAGTDGAIASCGQMGLFDLNSLLNAPFTSGGTWAETSTPPTGQLSGNTFNTSAVTTGVDYTFSYTVPASGACPSDMASFTVSLGNVDDVSLGNDTTICPGASVVLSPGVYDSYLWNNGSTNATRTVSAPGIYYVTVGTASGNATNVIINGDFESAQNFTTQYVPGPGGAFGTLSDPGTYAVTSSPNLVHNNFNPGQDHTPAPGTQQLVVNGSFTSNTNVWCQNAIPVSPNTFYQFGTWVTTVETGSTPLAALQFSIGGVAQGSVFSPASTSNTWTQFTTSWFSGLSTSTSICIVNQNTSPGGNDFAIDDITFIPLCSATDSITISNFPQPVVTATPNDTICSGETAQLTASSVTPGLSYTWNPGNLNTAQINVSPLTSTIYSVSAVSANGCSSNIVSRTIVVRPKPVAGVFVNGNDTVCAGLSTILTGSSSLPNSTFSWSPGTNITTQNIVTATAPASSYTLTVTTPFGCTDDSTVTITVIAPLEVSITGATTFCEGESSVLTATSPQAGMTFAWSTGATSDQITVTSADAGTISVTGDFFFCPQASASVQITPSPLPVVTVPADFVVCPGEPVFAEVSSDQPGSTFVWQPGNLTGASNTISTVSSVVYTVYAVNNGCVSASETFLIDASATCALVVPNVFTPNNDNNNDFFQLVSHEGIETLSCTILNRWGNTIRTFNTADFKWDGKDANGNTVSEGVYFYTITAKTKAGVVLEETGIVEVVR